MIGHRIGRAYASDVGVTDQFMDEEVEGIGETLGLDENQMVTYVFGEIRDNKCGADSVIDLKDL